MESSTQDFLQIKDIREGVVVLKNNEIRGIMMVSSTNFVLKSEEEQEAIIGSFQSLVNSLDFSCQIIIQSRNLNITPYLDSIKELEDRQTNELLKTQTASYAEFIKELVQGDLVMTKSFYIVVPYTLLQALGVGKAIKQTGIFSFLSGKRGEETKLGDEDFERCRNQLWQRMEFVAMGLKRCGLDCIPLTTGELIELFWSTNHIDEAEVGYSLEIMPEFLK